MSELVVIALGSNLGESPDVVLAAMDTLAELSHQPIRRSSLWCTEPWGSPEAAPDFVNAVVGLDSWLGESPRELLTTLMTIEQRYGRVAAPRNAPRILDLDLILYGDRQIAEPGLIVPHPRALERRFVLEPLSEIAPDINFPGTGAPLSELIAAAPAMRIERLRTFRQGPRAR